MGRWVCVDTRRGGRRGAGSGRTYTSERSIGNYMPAMDVIFFATPDELRAWLAAHHETAGELWVGFHKKGTGTPSVTWPEAVDEALCVGWIDGVRKGIDAASYTIRFTPRKPGSIWSAVNIARVAELERQGRMRPAGLAAFARRSEAK